MYKAKLTAEGAKRLGIPEGPIEYNRTYWTDQGMFVETAFRDGQEIGKNLDAWTKDKTIKLEYYRLEIKATDPTTEIWVCDDEDNFVQMEKGLMVTSLLPGQYFVQYGLGTKRHPIPLAGDLIVSE